MIKRLFDMNMRLRSRDTETCMDYVTIWTVKRVCESWKLKSLTSPRTTVYPPQRACYLICIIFLCSLYYRTKKVKRHGDRLKDKKGSCRGQVLRLTTRFIYLVLFNIFSSYRAHFLCLFRDKRVHKWAHGAVQTWVWWCPRAIISSHII